MIFSLIALLIIVADQLTKSWIRSFPEGQVIFQTGIFQFVHVRNSGAAFGVFPSQSLVLMIVASLGLALFLSKIPPGETAWMSGAKVGLVAGVCFSATGICISYMYEKRPWMLLFINAGYNVAGCVIAGIILSIWK